MSYCWIVLLVLFLQNTVFAHVREEYKHLSLKELKKVAIDEHEVSLLNAVKATKKALKIFPELSSKDFLQAAIFIETDFPKEEYYLPKSKTGLAYALEYDPDTKAIFVILEGSDAALGTGKMKEVTKAILYSHNHPKVVARAEQSTSMDKELEITKLMRGSPGIFETLGFGSHKKGSTTYTTIYSKLYSPGSLETMFEEGYRPSLDANRHLFSLYEKVLISLNILKGLEALHEAGIVHRDLGARNYLINIPEEPFGKRNIEACIADLGRADFIKNVGHTKVQGNRSHTSPEGLFLDKMTPKCYYKSDVFAVGCVFYRLIHGMKGPWQDAHYVEYSTIPVEQRYNEMMALLTETTESRRNYLKKKTDRSPLKEFEYIVLSMLHPYPKYRLSAKSARIKMEALFDSLQ